MRSVCSARLAAMLAAGVMIPTAAATADIQSFIFADVGTTYTGFLFPGNPIVGQEVVLTRIFLEVDVAPGADAADFDTDLSFPITPLPGNRNALSINGAELGWSGSGRFTYVHETTEYNGVFISTIYGAATAPMDAVILKESRVEMMTIPSPAGVAVLGVGAMLLRRRR